MPDFIMAKIYDFVLFPLVYPVRRIILSIVFKYHYKKLLDVCCGTGNQLKYLAAGGYSDVGVGVDISGPMLKIANRGAIAGKCLLGNAECLSFEDNHFDMTMISFALHEKEPKTAVSVVQEMIRVTKKNGHIILVDFSLGPSVPMPARAVVVFLERLAGREHFRNFRAYCNSDGLDSFIGEEFLDDVERYTAFFGAFTIRVLRKRETHINEAETFLGQKSAD